MTVLVVGVLPHEVGVAAGRRLRQSRPQHGLAVAREDAQGEAAGLGQARQVGHVAPAVGRPVLGEHQDAAIAADEWRDIAMAHPGDTALVLTCGRLLERERAAVHASRQLFAPVWAAADTPAMIAWLTR